MCWVIDIIKHASRVLKNDLYRCGSRVADRNVIGSSSTINIVENQTATGRGTSRLGSRLLLLFALLLGAVSQAQAGEFCVANPQFNGVVDGTVTYTDPPFETITQITIDGECTFKNFTAANPLDVTINYQTTDDTIYLITFDNVVFTGNMACAAIDHKLWVVNSAEGAFSGQCQDIIIPAETIDKQIPAATASIGQPFTYRLTLPSMEYTGLPSTNELGSITLTDDLNAMGVDVTLVGTPVVSWSGGGAVTHTFTNTSGLLSFSGFPSIPAGEQIYIDITVVLDDTVNNAPGKQFLNTANWTFSRWIDLNENGTVEANEFFDPLPGENGLSDPMTIAEPDLIVTKSSSETALNFGVSATFSIDVQNTGGTDAWEATILDQIPPGMCEYDPTTGTITAQVFAADGTTPVSGVLVNGTDYSVSYAGCNLTFSMLTAAAKIGSTERLIITYQSELDGIGTTNEPANGDLLVNIAGATSWYSADRTDIYNYDYITYSKTLTDGTSADSDHQDSYTITAALSGYYFQKTVENRTSGQNPATTAVPSDVLRYTLRLFNVDKTFTGITISDTLNPGLFDTSTFSMVTLPANTDYSFNSATGQLDIFDDASNWPDTLDLSTASELVIEFDIQLLSSLANATSVPNQAILNAIVDSVATTVNSDDPYVNGISAPGDPTDATTVVILSPGPLSKANTQTSARIGEQFKYTITVPATAVAVDLYDVRILDVLSDSSADLGFVSANVVTGGSWVLTNTGTVTSPIIEDTVTGIDIAAGNQAVIEITVELQNTTNNNKDDIFNNTASYTYNRSNGDSGTQTTGGGDSTSNMTVLESILTSSKTVTNVTPGKAASDPISGGDILEYTVTMSNSGNATAYDVNVVDTLPAELAFYSGFTPTATIDAVAVAGFVATPADAPAGPLVWGRNNSDESLDIPVGKSLILTYRVQVQVSTAATFSNSVAIDWTSLDGVSLSERTGTGCPTVIAPNDYCSTAAVTSTIVDDNNSLNKVVTADSWITGGSTSLDSNIRVGDSATYQLQISLGEGITNGVMVTDVLPAGLAFDSLVSISPASGAASFSYSVVSQPASGDTGTLVWDLGNITNTPSSDNTPVDVLTIEYNVRVLNNTLSQQLSTTLTNTATLSYTDSALAADQNVLQSSASITLLQPSLTMSKTAVAAGGDTILVAGEVVTYTIDIVNSGSAPAYDTVVQDILPLGMRQGGVTTTSITLVLAGSTLTSFAPGYDPATGIAIWNFDSGTADQYTIPVGETLRIVYTAQADATISPLLTLTNAATATLYYSFDDEALPNIGSGTRQTYGASNTAEVTLTSIPGTLQKATTQATATIGETFTYRITVPAPLATPLYDVRITDVLSDSAAALTFVSATVVSGGSWTLSNVNGTAKSLIIEDTNTGIDIPAGSQAVIDITVEVDDDLVTNYNGLSFTNTANYTYNAIDNNSGTRADGVAGTSGVMTILGADTMILQKTGPANMRIGLPATFTIDVQNTGDATAWDLTIADVLPDLALSGMCDTAPSSITAQVFELNGTTPVSAVLTPGTDYVTSFSPAPDCKLEITTISDAAKIAPTQRLIVSYVTSLDLDSASGVSLTNTASAIEWFGYDTAGAGATGAYHTYTGTLSDGTVATPDEQDAHTVITESPVLEFTKSVINVTSIQDPGTNAQPGDTLRYTLTIKNLSPVIIPDFSLNDELDALNATAMFVPGSLNIISVPAGADTSNTDVNGGTKGSGNLDIRSLSLAASGGADVVIIIEATLAAVINSGTKVFNQAHLTSYGIALRDSNDPGDPLGNGVDDPNVEGDEDPTETLIASAPVFEVFKTSTDLTGDVNILLAGDTLRYTITVKNIGNENAINTILKDQLPASTTYVAGSTTLNGSAITEPTPGTLPLQAGILINAPEDATAGAMRADTTATIANVATITFDVTINSSVVNGTIISNQGYVSASGAGSGAMADTPSDDPATATLNDPTRNVIGDQPLVDALKTVSIQTDNNGNGELDPGDILRYTITISNIGAANATGVSFIDTVPTNTTYVANSVTLNTIAVGQPDAGVSPLIAGIPVSSSDLTPPLPTAGNGTLTAGQSAVITFDVEVNAGVASGTIISNQGNVYSNELPVEATDADGIDSNGDQPTLIVVGNAQLLSITKTVSVVGGGAALAGGQLEYRILVTNISSVAATNVIITDNLDLPVAGQLTYVSGSGLLNGSNTGVSFADPIVTADYATPYGNLLTGESAELVFRVTINNALPIGTTITNTGVVYWNAGTQTANATISIDVGGTPGVANVNGQIWHDKNFDNIFDAGELALADWSVDIYRNTTLLGTVTTDASGNYSINGLIPNYIGTDRYDIRFRAPGSNATTAKLGLANSPPVLGYTDALHRIYNIVLNSGANVQNLNLPIDPNGVVYNSVVRSAIPGATISLLNAGTGSVISASCFDDVNQQNQVTTANGYYKFDLNFSQGDCLAGGDYLIRITPPATDYNLLPSTVITPQTDASTAAFDVPGCPGAADDDVATPAGYCEVQASELAPTLAVAPASAGTSYYLHLTLDNVSIPGDSQIFNNHLPIDPILTNAVSITKTSALVNVTRGKLVPYTITISNTFLIDLNNTSIVDDFPAGFKYVEGSARYNNGSTEVPLEPVRNGLRLTWSNINLPVGQTQTFKMLLIVGAAVNEGNYINNVYVLDTLTNTAASGTASATVRVVADPDFDCSDVIGKVFDDKNLNGYQDENENGLAGVKLVTLRGLVSSSDEYGRFHVTCAVAPNESRGSNFVIKLDERTLPTGYRVTTENPRVQRATRGKMLKFNFGSALHRVVSMDLADGVFVANSTEMHKQWIPRIDLLIKQLQEKPSVLRLSYLADVDDAGIVDDRLEKVKQDIIDKWLVENKYKLTIETEIFWRRGGPPDRGDID